MTKPSETGNYEETTEQSYHDKNLMVTFNKANDRVWINTHGTFWAGSYADLMDALRNSAPLSTMNDTTLAGDGIDNTSD